MYWYRTAQKNGIGTMQFDTFGLYISLGATDLIKFYTVRV